MALLLAVPAPAAEPAPPAHVVQDPHYGDVLFRFFQDRYFDALTGLMVSQHFARMPHHADEAEVLRGGLLLSYGLHREAGHVFARLIDTTTEPAVRDRAWFYLAKIRYQRGLDADAEQAIDRIQGPLPGGLEDERKLLKAQLLMAREDFAGAAALLAPLAPAENALGRYARFNLGVALLRAGKQADGGRVLDELGRLAAPDEETRALRDRANVALGFAALKNDRPEDARSFLERVRLQGLQSNKALLGFGWAAAAMHHPTQALVPWQALSARDPSDAAVLEARIAVPYAYAELGAYGQALARYEQAIGDFDREQRALDESIAAVREGRLLQGLIEANPGDEMGWFWHIDKLPAMPHAGHLAPLLAQHAFQEAFKNYRDLLFLARNLQQWADNLAVYRDMLATRRQGFAERLPHVREQAGQLNVAALQQRRDALAAELAAAADAADGAAFADARERGLMERIARVREVLSRAGPTADAAQARERLRLAEGALAWELAQQQPQRQWEAAKAMRTIEAQLAEAAGRDAALSAAERDEPARFEGFDARIDALAARIQRLAPRVAALTLEQQGAVQALAVAELQRQKERLGTYTVQARFAVAQLYDKALQAKEGGDAAR